MNFQYFFGGQIQKQKPTEVKESVFLNNLKHLLRDLQIVHVFHWKD